MLRALHGRELGRVLESTRPRLHGSEIHEFVLVALHDQPRATGMSGGRRQQSSDGWRDRNERLRTDLAARPSAVDPRAYSRGARDAVREGVATLAALVG